MSRPCGGCVQHSVIWQTVSSSREHARVGRAWAIGSCMSSPSIGGIIRCVAEGTYIDSALTSAHKGESVRCRLPGGSPLGTDTP